MPVTVAVVDDDAAYIRFVEGALAGTDYIPCPITTFSLDETIMVLATSGSSAALVDVFMYDAPAGFALVDAIRADERVASLPLVVASGAHDKLAKASAFLADKHCSVLRKPFGVDELIAALNAALAAGQPLPVDAGQSVAVPKLRAQPLTGTAL